MTVLVESKNQDPSDSTDQALDADLMRQQDVFIIQEEAIRLAALPVSSASGQNALKSIASVLATYLESQAHVSAILQAGYRQTELPTGPLWAHGHVEDPRVVKNRWVLGGLLWVGMSSFLAPTLYFITLFISPVDVTISSDWVLLTVGFVALGLVLMIANLIVETLNNSQIRKAGIDSWQPLFLVQSPPAEVMTKYHLAKASGLFEKIMVTAPRTAFTQPNPIDPIIYGVYRDQTYLIVRWGLENDLKEAGVN